MRRLLREFRYRVGVRLRRRSMELRLRAQLAQAGEAPKLIVGASGTAHAGWISTEYPVVDITDDGRLARFFATGSVAAVLAEHVWEHLSPQHSAAAARNLYALLRPGGYLRIAVPDGHHPDPGYREYARPGGSGEGSHDHKLFYTHETLSAVFAQAGFDVRLLQWFDASGIFHAQPWDAQDGLIERSARFDARNQINPTAYTSIVLDAVKPLPAHKV